MQRVDKGNPSQSSTNRTHDTQQAVLAATAQAMGAFRYVPSLQQRMVGLGQWPNSYARSSVAVGAAWERYLFAIQVEELKASSVPSGKN